MRDAFDLIVIGRGPAAALLASAVAAVGRKVLLVSHDPNHRDQGFCLWDESWGRALAHDRYWQALQLSPEDLRAIATDELIVSLPGDAGGPPVERRAWLLGTSHVTPLCRSRGIARGLLHLEDEVLTVEPGHERCIVRLADRHGRPYAYSTALVVDATRLGLVDRPAAEPVAVTIAGIYRHVAREAGSPGASGCAWRSGEAWFWMTPLSAHLTSVGVTLTTAARPSPVERARLWEDALVACPPLAERLLDARLEGELWLHSDPPPQVGASPFPLGSVTALRDEWFALPPGIAGWGLERSVSLANSISRLLLSRKTLVPPSLLAGRAAPATAPAAPAGPKESP